MNGQKIGMKPEVIKYFREIMYIINWKKDKDVAFLNNIFGVNN